jgi:ATP-dependent helicase/nuclease subunit A
LSDAQFISEGELKEQEISGECGQLLQREQFMYRITREEASEEELAQKEKLRQRMDRRYADEGLKELVTKTSVSELKKAQMDLDFAGELFPEKEIVPYIPAFMQEEQGMSGADRGSAYHRVMELLDFEKVLEAKAQIQEQNQEWKQNQEQDQSQKERHNEENNKEMNREENRSKKSEKSEADTYMILELERQIALMVEKELLQKPWSEAVSVKKLVIFFQSSLAQRMAKAQHLQKLKKEQPFVLGIAADRVKPQFPHEEQVLIQGIIDAFFEEGDDLILMDYKTDAVKTGEELVKRYHTQMEYYTEALERIVGKKVKERIIYSFALGEEIRM